MNCADQSSGDVGEVGAVPVPRFVSPFGWGRFVLKHRVLAERVGLRGAFGPFATHLALAAQNGVGWMLDALVAWGWWNEPVRGPLFIIGPQRSGTTYLHRLLSRELPNTCAMRFYEMVLPSLCVQGLLRRLAKLDGWMGGPLSKRLAHRQAQRFSRLDHIHHFRFDAIEEDEFVIWPTYLTDMCALDSPICTDERLTSLCRFDEAPESVRLRSMGWYRACVQKKLRRHRQETGTKHTLYISKNPRFSRRIPLLLRAFPDARFIYLVRDPLEVIASRLSLWEAVWRHRFPGFRDLTPAHVELALEDCTRSYLEAEEGLKRVRPDRKLVLPYLELVRDPGASVNRVRALLGMEPMSRGEQERLLESQPPNRPKHQYSLARFGIEASDVRARLAGVFDKYGF